MVAGLAASRARRYCLPRNQRRRLPRCINFGAQSHGLFARCLRFAASLPGCPVVQPRKTRFRLVVSLCRTGSAPAWVPGEVSARLHRFLLTQALPGALDALSPSRSSCSRPFMAGLAEKVSRTALAFSCHSCMRAVHIEMHAPPNVSASHAHGLAEDGVMLEQSWGPLSSNESRCVPPASARASSPVPWPQSGTPWLPCAAGLDTNESTHSRPGSRGCDRGD